MSSALQQVFSDIANSIRSKLGTTDTINPYNMSNSVNNIDVAGPLEINTRNTSDFYKMFNYPIIMNNSSVGVIIENTSIFNSPISFTNNVTSITGYPSTNQYQLKYAIQNCENFDQPITLSESIKSVSNLIRNCNNFNSPIFVNTKLTSCDYLISNCPNYNQPILVNFEQKNIKYLFRYPYYIQLPSCNKYNIRWLVTF